MEDDSALLARLRAGDEPAFEALVARHDGALRRVARTFVRTDSAADDVVQETWLGVVRGLAAFEGRSSLRTWIFRILVNQARTRGSPRRAQRALLGARTTTTVRPSTRPPSAPTAAGGARRRGSRPIPRAGLLSAELRDHLLEAVDSLSADQRAVITLRDLVGLRAGEVCDLLEISEGNQRVLLHRARARVRAALAPLVEVSR